MPHAYNPSNLQQLPNVEKWLGGLVILHRICLIQSNGSPNRTL